MISITGGHRVEIEVESQVGTFLVHEQALGAEVLIGVDDLVGRDGVGDNLDGDAPTLLTMDSVANIRVGFKGYEDLARSCGSLKPGSKINAAADDGVVHPILAAEVPYSAVARVDSDPALEGLFDARRPPHGLQREHPLPHGDGHLDAGEGVLLDAACLRIAEEDDDGVADVLVDRRSIGKGNLRHLGQIVVQQPGQLLGLQAIRRLGEAGDVGKEDGQLFPATRDFDFLFPGEDRLVDLGRKVFRELVRELLHRPRFFRELVLALLQLCNVRVYGHRTTLVDLALADQDPATVASLLDVRAARFQVTGQAFADPLLDPAVGIPDVTALGGASNEAFERHARRYLYGGVARI